MAVRYPPAECPDTNTLLVSPPYWAMLWMTHAVAAAAS